MRGMGGLGSRAGKRGAGWGGLGLVERARKRGGEAGLGRMGPGTMGQMEVGGWGSATDCERWSACDRAACGELVSGRRDDVTA